MNLFKKISLIFVALLLVLAVVGGLALSSAVRQPWPQVDGSLSLPGLSASVTVIRDRYGVPHIYADTPADLFAAQGFVHAQERFYQMEFWRRIGQGRLSEMLGKATLEQDKFIRTVGWNRAVQADFDLMSPDSKKMLEAYSTGVNAYIGPRKSAPASLALEFRLLALGGRSVEIEDWQPIHTLTWPKVIAWDLRGDGMDQELIFSTLMEKGGANLLRALRPDYPGDMPVIAPRVQASLPTNASIASSNSSATISTSAESLLTSIRSMDNLLGHDSANGSNNWVVNGYRSATGRPLLADDPHLGIQMPGIWFQVGLHCRALTPQCPYDVVGASFAGSPGVVLGHNSRIAWGVTNVGTDVQDLYLERQNPEDPDEFAYQGKWEKATVIEERINIAGADPVNLKVRVTRHGPIMNDVNANMRDFQPLALRWSALQGMRLVDSVFALNRAQSFQQFREALYFWDAPAQNIIYADVDGNIGYQMTGLVPIRTRGTGDVPSPGWSGEYEWNGYLNFNEQPSVLNPNEGMIASANNAVTEPGTKPFIANDFDFGFRARRIVEILRSKDRFTRDDFVMMQLDAESGLTRDALPIIRATMGDSAGGDVIGRQAWGIMLAWGDRPQTEVDSAGALIWETYWNRLMHEIFDDELGPQLANRAIGMGSTSRIALRNMLANQQDLYWDDVNTTRREPAFEIMERAWTATIKQLSGKYGANAASWTWGRAHTATFKNQSLGRSGNSMIENIFNRGPFAVNGSNSALNATSAGEDMEVRSVPSMRMILDVGAWDNSLMIHTTGQSGHPYHKHYDDFIPLWRSGYYNPLLYSPELVKANRAHELTLTP